MSITGVSNGADLLSMISSIGQPTNASDASMSVVKKAIDAQSQLSAEMVNLVNELASGSQLNVYA